MSIGGTANGSMVTYVTQVVAQMPHDTESSEEAYSPAQLQSYIDDMRTRLERVHKMMTVLEAHGFKFLRRRYEIVAYSSDVEAFAVKQILHDAGFSNHEFSIHLDYTRRWGVL